MLPNRVYIFGVKTLQQGHVLSHTQSACKWRSQRFGPQTKHKYLFLSTYNLIWHPCLLCIGPDYVTSSPFRKTNATARLELGPKSDAFI